MLHPKQYITDLSEICYQRGIRYIVISPGSRNAPLVEAFYSRYGDHCISIVDERSAAYFALGLARYTKSVVALVCTSGTAVLNYSPALAEAYYARVPLLAITADRPAEWIDQQDNQTIRQKEVYRNFILFSINLPEYAETTEALEDIHRKIHKAIDSTLFPDTGPVHLNVPLREPLYEALPPVSGNIVSREGYTVKNIDVPDTLIKQWNAAQRVMIIHGLDYPDSGVKSPLLKLASDSGVIVIAENISNVSGDMTIANPEMLLTHSTSKELIPPELILYSGGQIVSKRLKQYLRGLKNLNVWRIGLDSYPMDTFKQQNRIFRASPDKVYDKLANENSNRSDKEYIASWSRANSHAIAFRDKAIDQLPFSDLSVIKGILQSLPEGINLELGNSTPIRYSQYFDSSDKLNYFSNRGISGIDGCLSSAVGTAFNSKSITLAILGDLSFIYDSNALWNRRLPSNLRIIVINNRGGGIFSLLEGPAGKQSFEGYIEAYHPVDIQKLTEAFNLDYSCVREEDTLINTLPLFLKESGKAKLMEIQTDRLNNNKAFSLITGRSSVV